MTIETTSTVPLERIEPKAYVWAMRYYCLYVDEHDTLAEAVAASSYASDAGEEAIVCIEVPAEGRVYRGSEVSELWDELRRKEEEAEAKLPPRPPNVAAVQVASPIDGEKASMEWFTTHEAAQDYAAEVGRLFGHDRVSIREFRR